MMFSNRLSLLLQVRQITAYKVAKDAGISQGLMNEYKNGVKQPSIQNLIKIANCLDVSVDYLLGRTDAPDTLPPLVPAPMIEEAKPMYTPQEVAKRIKLCAKQRGIPLRTLLSSCGLGINTISKMGHGRDILAMSLARIADQLDVSLDYLHGRTNNPDSHR